MDEQQVRAVMDTMIEHRENRIKELRSEVMGKKVWEQTEQQATINLIQHGLDTLIELQHRLRLCGCPDEAYQS
jgi:aryl carrier-like protein